MSILRFKQLGKSETFQVYRGYNQLGTISRGENSGRLIFRARTIFDGDGPDHSTAAYASELEEISRKMREIDAAD